MGRTQGRGRGRGRHQQGRGKSSNKKEEKNKPKKEVSQMQFQVGAAKQASEYTNIKKYCINFFRKNYTQGHYIASAIEDGVDFDFTPEEPLPLTLEDESGTPEEISLAKGINESRKIQYKIKMDAHNTKLQTFEENKYKAYAFLWDKCSSQMKQNIEAKSDYVSDIKNNPYLLLKTIESLSYNYQESKYEIAIIFDAIKNFVMLRQKDDESITNYLERFKAAQSNMKTQLGGELVLAKFVKGMDGYDVNDYTKTEELVKEAYEMFKAYVFIANSDNNKYGSLIKNLAQQQSLKNNQHPTTLTKASEALNEHQWDAKYFETKKKKKEQSRRDREDDSTIATTPSSTTDDIEISFAQLQGACHCCGKKGHSSDKCYKKDTTPKDQWHINKLQKKEQDKMMAQVQNETASVVSTTTTPTDDAATTTNTAWSGAHISMNHIDHYNLRNVIMLDNGSTTSLFANKQFVQDIKEVDKPLELLTNGGEINPDHKATVKGFGEVWHDPNSIANIFSFAELKKKHRITYDSDKEDAFLVHQPDKIVKFTGTNEGLYLYKPPDRALNLLNTVKENEQLYTGRQLARAKLARRLCHNVGAPSIRDFKAIVRMNAIANSPVTVEDINVAEQVYGADIGSLKGKTTQSKPKPVVKDYIEIPKQLYVTHNKVTLAIDTMYVNKIPFLTSISDEIMYRTAQPIVSKTPEDYRSAIDVIFRLYNDAGFTISTIKADNEFKPLMNPIKDDLDVTMNYAAAQEHAPEAERNHRTIKERFRAHFQRMPYKNIPKVMIKYLVMDVTKKLNYFPPKGGISEFYSPRMILHQTNLDYNKHFRYEFGQYVQAHNDDPKTKNTPAPRTLDCIYLRCMTNQQGGHELLDLASGRVITRHAVTEVPISNTIIQVVEALAKADGMTNIKFIYKTAKNASALLAGVDDDDDDEDSDDDTYNYLSDDDDDESYDEDEVDPNDLTDEDLNIANNNITNNQPDQPAVESDDEDDEEEEDESEIEIEFEEDDGEDPPLFENYEDDTEEEPQEEPQVRRSAREHKPPEVYKPSFENKSYQHLITQANKNTEYYDDDKAKIAAKTIHKLNLMHQNKNSEDPNTKALSFVETYNLKKGLQKFGDKGHDAAYKEMKQLHD